MKKDKRKYSRDDFVIDMSFIFGWLDADKRFLKTVNDWRYNRCREYFYKKHRYK